MILLVVVLAVLVALSGFFSGGEIALFSVPDTRAEALAEEGRRGSAVRGLVDDHDKQVSGPANATEGRSWQAKTASSTK